MDARFRWRLWAAVFGILAVPFVLAGGGNAQELKLWRHGVLEAKSDAGFVFMVADGGFGKKQGLDVKILQFKGDALALRAMLAGELDSYEGNPGAPIIASSHGGGVKIAGCYWPGLTYAIYSKPSINSIAELMGKTFALSSPGSLPDLVVRAVLEKHNIPASEVHFSVMGSDADRFKAVSAGLVDAGAASTGFEPIAKKNNVKVLVSIHDEVPNYLRFCINVSDKTLKERSDDLAHFLAAEMEAQRYALAHRDAVIALTAKMTHSPPNDPRAAFVFDEVKQVHAIDPELKLPVDKLDWMQQLFVRTGNLKAPIDVKSLVAPGPREAALKLVGK
jgi:NitT/TauT family transport system substrate-binding protein